MRVTQFLSQSLLQGADRPLTVHGERTRSVAESADRIARLAAGLRRLDAGDGARIAVLSLNSDRYHECFFAVSWAGSAIVPLNTRWSVAEIAYALQDCAATVLIVDEAFAPMIPQLREHAVEAVVVYAGDGGCPDGVIDYEDLIEANQPSEDAARGGDELYGVFYTGGTTGHPKGVMLSHRNVITSALGSLATGGLVSREGRLLHVAPMFHLGDITAWLAGTIIGTTHVFLPTFTPQDTFEAIETHHVTDVMLVPTMIQLLVDHPTRHERDLSSLRHLLYGSSPISESLLTRAKAAFVSAQFTQAYGMTELGPVATLLLDADHDDATLRRSAGRAVPHAEVGVRSAEDTSVPIGTVGEIVVRGDHVMQGYWGQPELTAQAVRSGWMHTGDAGYLDERGYLFIVDRVKDMIVSGGENVYSAEVENVLAGHPAVAACAVIGVPDDKWGERVHAEVVVREGGSATSTELQDYCRGRIAGYKVPRSIVFPDALPVSAAGKVLKRELRSKYWAGRDRRI